MPSRLIVIVSLVVVGVVVFAWLLLKRSSPAVSLPTPLLPSGFAGQDPTASTKVIDTKTIKNVAAVFTFSAEVPSHWQAEAIAAIEAISFYDPATPDQNNLEKSQIFIRYFTANDFLTLATVTIHSRESLTIASRPTVRYDIAKKIGVPDFANQPQWRSERHIVTDIRVSDQNPSIFYVIAKRPELAPEIYNHFLETLKFH